MNKIIIFFRYFKDFIKHHEFIFVFTSIKYQLFKKTSQHNRLYRSSLGLFISRKNSIDFQFANYAYEWNVKKFILDNYKEYTTFIDIGSHIGTYCFLLAPKGLRCFAFEPTKENFRALHINILLNKLENQITAFNIGLGSENTNEDFIFEEINTGASHRANHENGKNHETVIIRTFDSIYANFNIDVNEKILIKIDVEGMEAEVIKGATQFLSKYPNLLIVMESIHSGENNLKNKLLEIGDFEFFKVDSFNMAAKKH
jgi:FkbM family methyltransferase